MIYQPNPHMTMEKAHKILELSSPCSDEEIRVAFILKVKQFDPEIYPMEFMPIEEAYNLLDSLKKR